MNAHISRCHAQVGRLPFSSPLPHLLCQLYFFSFSFSFWVFSSKYEILNQILLFTFENFSIKGIPLELKRRESRFYISPNPLFKNDWWLLVSMTTPIIWGRTCFIDLNYKFTDILLLMRFVFAFTFTFVFVFVSKFLWEQIVILKKVAAFT